MSLNFCELTVIFLLLSVVYGQISNNLDSVDKTIQKNPDLSALKKQLEENGVDLSSLNKTKIDPEKIENVLREKCKKQNATDAIDDLKNQQDTLKECVQQNINTTQLQEELEESKKTGSMDEVFAKYCNKWPAVYACFDNATVAVRQCMSEKEETAFNKTLDIVEEFQAFMCHKDGDRLAMFVADGGFECIEKQQEVIKDCANATFGLSLPKEDDLSVASLPTFLFSDSDCDNFEKFRLCVNGALEKCDDTTPANIVDAAFKFLKKQMPCESFGDPVIVKAEAASLQNNSGFSVTNSMYVSLVSLFFLLKFY